MFTRCRGRRKCVRCLRKLSGSLDLFRLSFFPFSLLSDQPPSPPPRSAAAGRGEQLPGPPDRDSRVWAICSVTRSDTFSLPLLLLFIFPLLPSHFFLPPPPPLCVSLPHSERHGSTAAPRRVYLGDSPPPQLPPPPRTLDSFRCLLVRGRRGRGECRAIMRSRRGGRDRDEEG